MVTPNVFDLYNDEEEEEVPQLRRKSSRRQTGETSQRPAKKSRTEDPPRHVPAGQTSIHPPDPAEKETPPAPKIPPPAPKNPSPAAPSREQDRREETLGAKLSSCVVRAAKDRITHIGKNDRVKDAMVKAESMTVDLILNRTLNEISSALLSATTARTRAQVSIEQARAKAIEGYQVKATKEISAAEARHIKELEAMVQQRDAAVTKLSEAEAAKASAIKSRQEY
ncbi:KNR4/SMI1 homolog [Humulus lupulus]|uniref:KNR4/SMI1 homolog n=1 Tax=Humulus lupulus TaxID=3486 RepID=UPI002B40BAFE|nr:KNR4/SMI1 homolog [Humulus lupulus]